MSNNLKNKKLGKEWIFFFVVAALLICAIIALSVHAVQQKNEIAKLKKDSSIIGTYSLTGKKNTDNGLAFFDDGKCIMFGNADDIYYYEGSYDKLDDAVYHMKLDNGKAFSLIYDKKKVLYIFKNDRVKGYTKYFKIDNLPWSAKSE